MICKSSGTLCSLPNNPQLSHTCPPGDWGQGLPSLHISCLQKRKRVSSSGARERASTSRLRLQAHRLVCVQVCTRVASSSSTDTLTTSPLTHVRARVLARLAQKNTHGHVIFLRTPLEAEQLGQLLTEAARRTVATVTAMKQAPLLLSAGRVTLSLCLDEVVVVPLIITVIVTVVVPVALEEERPDLGDDGPKRANHEDDENN